MNQLLWLLCSFVASNAMELRRIDLVQPFINGVSVEQETFARRPPGPKRGETHFTPNQRIRDKAGSQRMDDLQRQPNEADRPYISRVVPDKFLPTYPFVKNDTEPETVDNAEIHFEYSSKEEDEATSLIKPTTTEPRVTSVTHAAGNRSDDRVTEASTESHYPVVNIEVNVTTQSTDFESSTKPVTIKPKKNDDAKMLTTTPEAFLDERSSFTADVCPTGQVKINTVCVQSD